MINEMETLKAARRGSLPDFNRLVRQYQDDVYDWACWLLKDAHSAEAATQQVFIQAFGELSRFRGGSFRAWLLSATARTCQKKTPGQRTNGHVPTAVVHPGLQGLPPENQETAFLVEMLDLSYTEAALVQGVTVETICSRIAQARRHAAKQIKAQFLESPGEKRNGR